MKTTVNVKWCTILFHADNLNMSYIDSNIVSSILDDIGTEYSKCSKMTITRVKIHNYLGTTMNYSLSGKLIFYMVEYIG